MKPFEISPNWNQNSEKTKSYEWLKENLLFAIIVLDANSDDLIFRGMPFVALKNCREYYEGHKLMAEPIKCNESFDNRGYYYTLDLYNRIARVYKKDMINDPERVLISRDLEEVSEIFLSRFNPVEI